MRRLAVIMAGAAVALTVAHPAQAQVTLNSVRVAAVDTVALARFYQGAFGMFEVNRIALPAGPEIFMNFGATADAVKAAGGTMDGEPRPFGNTGIVIGFAVDPAGNRIELIQPKK